MKFFYGRDVVTNPLYCKIRSERSRFDRKAKRLTERMWANCCQFIDANAVERARTDDFYPVWWELYVAYALSRAGVSLVPSKERPCVGRGLPDLLAANPRIWIEAVMPQPGTGADALIEPPDDSNAAFSVPAVEFVLRLRTAVQEKSAKLYQYIKDGTIQPSEATVIAVSGARLPFRFTDYPVPNIVRAVLGVGNLQIHIGIATNKVLGTSVEYRDHVLKKSEAHVSTDFFLQEESAHVSAVLYSPCDCVNYPRKPGADFILVHNPSATVPLTDDWLPAGTQYWMDGNTLRRAP